MIDLKLPENEDMRVPLWNKFEEIADEYPELWQALEETFTCPIDVRCEMCFLMEKVAPILIQGKKAQLRYSMEEAEAVSSILYGSLPRKRSCDCGLKEALNEVSGENRNNLPRKGGD
jgi:hypothetical protein